MSSLFFHPFLLYRTNFYKILTKFFLRILVGAKSTDYYALVDEMNEAVKNCTLVPIGAKCKDKRPLVDKMNEASCEKL